jgi:dihydrolipoamide dehydrogenase
VGCIPSKALIHAADEFHKAVGFAADSKIGVAVAEPRLDFAKTPVSPQMILCFIAERVLGLPKSY